METVTVEGTWVGPAGRGKFVIASRHEVMNGRFGRAAFDERTWRRVLLRHGNSTLKLKMNEGSSGMRQQSACQRVRGAQGKSVVGARRYTPAAVSGESHRLCSALVVR